MSQNSFLDKVTFPAFVLLGILMPLISGCGDGEFPVRPAKGKVVWNGQPVTAGTITFSPVGDSGKIESGKPATGTVGPDGTFVLTTNDRFDGAVVGKHRVQYVGSEDEEAEGGDEDMESPTDDEEVTRRPARKASQKNFVQKDEIIVEVKDSGDNDFTIEVVPATE